MGMKEGCTILGKPAVFNIVEYYNEYMTWNMNNYFSMFQC